MLSADECLHLLNYLLLKLQNLQETLQAELAISSSSSSACVGQIACDYVEKHVNLATHWIEEWLHEEEDGIKSSKHQSDFTFYEFLLFCEAYVDSDPEVREKLVQIENLFLPRCSIIDPSMSIESSRLNTSRSQESGKLSARKMKK